MSTRQKLFQIFLIVFLISNYSAETLHATEYVLFSPDKQIQVKINIEEKVTYSIFYKTKEIIAPSAISLTLNAGKVLGKNPKSISYKTENHRTQLKPVIPTKSRIIEDNYNELVLEFENNFSLIFRAYDDGVAYRFATTIDDSITIISEEANFNFAQDHHVYYPKEESFISHFERYYDYLRLTEIGNKMMCSLPALVDVQNGPKVLISEADVYDYPGMFLSGDNSFSLQGIFPKVILKTLPGRKPDRHEIIEEQANYLALTKGERQFPWRVLIIAEEDKGLIESEMIYKLAAPLQLQDTSWLKPGKVAWDWWNANNIYGVDFKAGINTATYKYYIDFASQYNIEYVILDEGWSQTDDILNVIPEIDIEEICQYAKTKNVGIILWVLWKPLENQLDEALEQFSKWGVKGIKVDFMQRHDQWMVNYYYKIAKEAAKRHLLVDFHGSYKPCGLRRAYPNVLTREGVRGLEQSKWNDLNTPEHNVTLPFIRMVVGPMDYTPGAMVNAQKSNFKPTFNRPMSMGTRCHQLAMYVVYESPLQMLCDNPSNYLKEEGCMAFLSAVPTVWDKTIVLEAKVGDYVIIARKRGEDWYIGAMTDWSPREFEVDMNFLDKRKYNCSIYEDGINSDRYGSDYHHFEKTISQGDSLRIKLAPGGGWVAKISQM